MAATPLPPDIQVIAAPLLIGYLLNWGLYGALAVQVYIYYMAFPNDRLAIKSLVAIVFTLETLQSVLVAHDAYNDYARGFGNLNTLGSAQLEWLSVPILSGIISCTVQIFFAYRISVLSKSRAALIVISLIALTQGISAIVQGIQACILGNFAKLQKEAFASCTVWLVGSAVCDIIIAVCMSYYLSRMNTRFRATKMLVNKLIHLSIETGTMTATFATIDIILFITFPNNSYHATVALTLAKLYSNTLILIFNSRLRIIGGRDTTQSTELMELNIASTSSSRTKNGGSQLTVGNSLAVNVSREMMRDYTINDDLNTTKASNSAADMSKDLALKNV
ncbi:hypothetical protein BDP27DRAFT_1304455 [Rhodocollybia butyracea]|uniref:DUF6534 domain-containing protein n=1 Tax=Rhodocollybia butyracea TaxID=206335 RepID=A0A9P5TX47_9AGAR|nr:hypothetical protein BDP27DRAFT_1304455 [Rhodocollybia butyracea]